MSQQTMKGESLSLAPLASDKLEEGTPKKATLRKYPPMVGLLFAIAALVVLGLLIILRPFDVSFTVGASIGANFAVIATACFLLCFPSYSSKPIDSNTESNPRGRMDSDWSDGNPSNAQTIERIVLIVLLMFCIGALTLLAKG
jgi:hypothetical protein